MTPSLPFAHTSACDRAPDDRPSARGIKRPIALLAGLSLALVAGALLRAPLGAQQPAPRPAQQPRAPRTAVVPVADEHAPAAPATEQGTSATPAACMVGPTASATGRPEDAAGRTAGVATPGTVAAGAPCTPAAPAGTAATLRTAAGATRVARPARRRGRPVVRTVTAEAPVIAARRQVPGARPLSAAQLLDAATREYRETGVARPVVLGAVTAFPYGVSDPVVTCGTLRACLIDLEPGERLVTKPLAGDMKPGGRWYVGTAPVGADSANTLVWVKPTDCGLATNLVLSTDRRVYTLALESPACDRAGDRTRARGAASHFTFYFPDSTVPGAVPRPAQMAQMPAGAAPAGRDLTLARYRALYGAESASGAALAGIPVDVARMNFDYRVKRDKRFPWAPAQVFDDAVHTFIKIPPEAAAHPAPALFELTDGGGKTLMNYTVRDGFYVVDRTFRRAVLTLGQGKQEQRIELDNPHFGTPVPVVFNPAGPAGGR